MIEFQIIKVLNFYWIRSEITGNLLIMITGNTVYIIYCICHLASMITPHRLFNMFVSCFTRSAHMNGLLKGLRYFRKYIMYSMLGSDTNFWNFSYGHTVYQNRVKPSKN